MIEKLEIKHLRILNALYRFANLSQAAEYLEVSPQAISLQLNKLRSVLNDQLFVRSGHGMAPSAYAKQLEPHVDRVLQALNEIPLPASIAPKDTERTLSISATDYSQKIIIGELIKALRLSAPGVKLLLANIEVSQLTKKMQQGEIDLALTSSGYVPTGLLAEPLFVENYRCVSANKDLAAVNELSIEQLVEWDFIVTSPGVASFKGSADRWFEQQGLSRKVVLSVPSFFMALESLQASNTVAFIPSRLLPVAGLYDIPLKKYPPGYELVAAYHPRVKEDPLLIWVLAWMKQHFS